MFERDDPGVASFEVGDDGVAVCAEVAGLHQLVFQRLDPLVAGLNRRLQGGDLFARGVLGLRELALERSACARGSHRGG